MLVAVFRLLSRLPLRWLQRLGAVLGLLVYAFPGRYRRRLRAHAAQAGHDSAAFARRAAAHTGIMMLETAWVWFRPGEARALVHTAQRERLRRAAAEGRPVVFLTPHLGNFELAARFAAQYAPIHVLYRPPRQAALRPLVETSRQNDGVRIAAANRQGLRQLLRALREGQMVGILPDQVPGAGDGAWADFFGRPAYTMTLPARLAADPEVMVIAATCARLPGGRGWQLHLEDIDDRPDPSPEAQAAWINAIMMRLIERCPEQYLWSYHRYKQP